MSTTLLVAPHPDDEVLGGSAVMRDGPVTVVHVTDGVPPWIDARERSAVRSARRAECAQAWQALSAEVDWVQLGYPDLRAWRSVEELAASLGEVAVASSARTVFLPAYQRGHPDHDATFLAGALAAEGLAGRGIAWWVYGLYGLDSSRRLRFGCLPPTEFPGVVQRGDRDLLSVKDQALRQFTSQLWPDSALNRWLGDPSPEQFAPLPPVWRRIPAGPSFYDEQLGFARHGAGAAVVEATFARVLAQPGPGPGRGPVPTLSP
jgi:LmbE family N-acetylglucosaminyl deacetylase